MNMKWNGATALVTGASSGIGAQFATALAARQCDIILVARREQRLRELATALATTYRVRVDVIAVDLSTSAGVDLLIERLREDGRVVDVLVNNAGFATHGRFDAEDIQRVGDEVALNVGAVVSLTRALLPGMVDRGRGAVVNVASTAAFQPIPFMAVYGATKAFVLSFTEALWGELEKTGVAALALCPGATETEFFDVAGEAASVGRKQAPAEVVAAALRALDRRNPPPSIVSGRVNAVSSWLPRYLSRRTTIRVTRRLVAPAK
jgi:short-subunit dehydrogenase